MEKSSKKQVSKQCTTQAQQMTANQQDTQRVVSELWKVFHSVPNRTDGPKREPRRNPSAVVKPDMHNPIPIKHTNAIPTHIDHIPSNTAHSGSSAMLYVFEDSKAVIRMIIKGRSPTMRHVSRTHRVALDWLFDRINLDPKIQIRYS